MLFIYYAIQIGGIETFIIRIARQRFRLGLKTKILLLGTIVKSDKKLLAEIKNYAEVIFSHQLFEKFSFLCRRLMLIAPISFRNASNLLDGVSHIHVANGYSALFAHRLISLHGSGIKITFGFYHYLEFESYGCRLRYFESINRSFVLNYLPKESLFVFYNHTVEFIKNKYRVSLVESPLFPIGVVDQVQICKWLIPRSKSIKICSVGRLVDYKPYNSSMIDVVEVLLNLGYSVSYDIYGDGPDRTRIQNLIDSKGLKQHIKIRGTLDYCDFQKTVSEYDVFVGCGTAVIEASSIGVPSILAIDTTNEPLTYGFFCDVSQIDMVAVQSGNYNAPKIRIDCLLIEFLKMPAHRQREIIRNHIECVSSYKMDVCEINFRSYGKECKLNYNYSPILYEISYKSACLIHRLHSIFSAKKTNKYMPEALKK